MLTNYYEIFRLNPDWNEQKLCEELAAQKRIWLRRLNDSDSEKVKVAEQQIKLIEEAVKTFIDPGEKTNYDNSLKKANQFYSYEENNESQDFSPLFDYSEEETINNTIQNEYNNGNLQGTIYLCNNYLDNNIKTPAIYYYLAGAQWDCGNNLQASTAILKGLEIFPDNVDLHILSARIHLYARIDYPYAERSLCFLLQNDLDNSYYQSLYIYFLMISGEMDKAEHIIKVKLEKEPGNVEFRSYVARRLIDYSDLFIVQLNNGASYIPSQEAYNSILYYRQKADDIYSDEDTRDLLNRIVWRGEEVLDDIGLNKKGTIEKIIYWLIMIPLFPIAIIFEILGIGSGWIGKLVMKILNLFTIESSKMKQWQYEKKYVDR